MFFNKKFHIILDHYYYYNIFLQKVEKAKAENQLTTQGLHSELKSSCEGIEGLEPRIRSAGYSQHVALDILAVFSTL